MRIQANTNFLRTKSHFDAIQAARCVGFLIVDSVVQGVQPTGRA
jgi:hypothetical protein